MPIRNVPASDLPKILESDEFLIDVRTPAEFRSEHVAGADNLPLDHLDAEAFCREHGTDSPVYILCQSGKRSQKAADRLAAAGHEDPVVVEGGTAAAIEAGVEIEKGKQSVSIERQVRIAAGVLVFLGALAGWFIHPALLLIPILVGAGLAFSGITDTCGMAMVLAKCPWNR